MKNWSWLSVAILLLLSCNKVIDSMLVSMSHPKATTPGFMKYTIRKGAHYAENTTYKIFHQKELRFQVIFDSSSIYENVKHENQYDINKLYGFSDCGTGHHENSARFGWRWNGKSIEIHAYWYHDSVRNHQLLGIASIGRPIDLAIKISREQYTFVFNDKTDSVSRNCNSEMIQGYQLYPYFGGDETAPHDINILIKEL